MKKIIFPLFTIFSIAYSGLYAQSIKGVITDSKNHQPVAYATVSLLKGADSSQLKGALAGENGGYLFENLKPGKYLLSAQMVGYARQMVPVTLETPDLKMDINLSQDIKQLGEVTVKSSRPLVERRADKIIFNVENSVVAAGNNTLELLKMTPMVSLTPENGIKLKGKENVMLMLDGKTVPGATLSDLLQSLSAEQISKIELITNPSAKYDAAATGGIINIVTKKGTNMGLNGIANFSATESNHGKYSGGLSLNDRNSRINLYGTLNARDGKGYRNEELTRLLDIGGAAETLQTPFEMFTHSKAVSGKVGIDYTLNELSSIGFSVDGIFSRSDNRTHAVSPFRNSAGNIDSVLTSASNPRRNNNYTAYDLYYKNKLGEDGGELLLDLNQTHFNGLSRQHLNMQLVPTGTGEPVENSLEDNSTRSLFNITTFQADYTLPLKDGLLLESGIKDTYTHSGNQSFNQQQNGLTSPPDSSFTSYKENILAGYVNFTKQVKTWKLQAGIRTEQTDARLSNGGLNDDYLKLFPSALISKKFSDNYQLTIDYTSRITRPAYEALIPFVVPVDRYSQEKGNPDLKPEYANSFELINNIRGITLTFAYTHTHNAIADFIQQDPQTLVWTFSKGNFTRKQSFSVALQLPVTVTGWWNMDNSLLGFYDSYSSDNVGGAAYDHSKFSCTINSINTFSLPYNLKAELNAVYGSPSISGLYQVSHTSGVDAGVSRSFLEKKLNIKLAVNDIFHDNGYHLSSNAGNIHLYGQSYTDSRRVIFALSYKFGKNRPLVTPNKENLNKQRLNL
jgi:hypothetical protein